jgi:hypothetical protein
MAETIARPRTPERRPTRRDLLTTATAATVPAVAAEVRA